MKRFVLVAAVAGISCQLLSGCSTPSTAYPTLSRDAVSGEAQYQSGLSGANAKVAYKTASSSVKSAAQARFKRVGNRVAAAGAKLCKEIRGTSSGCVYNIALTNQTGLNAYADGSKIFVTGDMLLFADQETELANIIAHEYAHNIMKHVQSQKQNTMIGALLGTAVDSLAASQGINTGRMGAQLGAKGAQLRYSKGFEAEADYVGIYIMARAGYDTSSAGNFWRKMASVSPNGIYVGSTHPTSAERYLALQRTHNEVANKRNSGRPLTPDIRKK